jgi:hypothetical protein
MFWDPIRVQWVAATPEEAVRQKLIQQMIDEWGYPKGLIAVEKELSSGRRLDLVCYASLNGRLVPLLLVECKAEKISKEAEEQALGYNESFQAPFVCLASSQAIKTFWREQGKVASVPFLPLYEQLVEKIAHAFKSS